MDEFDGQRGERQQRGDARVFGLGAPREAGVVGVSPPANLQVQAVFETRPIAGFDFAFSRSVGFDANGVAEAMVQTPNGYTAVLRRVEFNIAPPDPNTSTAAPARLVLTRDDSAIQNNEVLLFGPWQTYTWHTHHVFGFWQRFGARVFCAIAIGAPTSEIVVRFFGVLIPSRSLAYPDEIASGPVVTVSDAKG